MPPAPTMATRAPTGFTVQQHVEVAQHLGALPSSCRGSRVARALTPVASSTSSKPFRSRRPRCSSAAHAGVLDAAAEVAQRLAELLLARDALGHVELAADLTRGVEQVHLVAALGQRRGAARPAGPAPTTAMRFCADDRGGRAGLVARARVDEAGGDLAAKVWSRQAWLQAMQVLISAARPARGLVDEFGVGQQGARHDTMSAQPSASTCSATSGVLMRLLVMTGIVMPSARLSAHLWVTQAKAARGTLVAMVGMRASCQPMPVLMSVAPAAAIALASSPPRPSCCRRGSGRASTGGR
jgi:hypothetical protein